MSDVVENLVAGDDATSSFEHVMLGVDAQLDSSCSHGPTATPIGRLEAPAVAHQASPGPVPAMMETVLEATTRLRKAGFVIDFTATENGYLRCGACRGAHDPASMVVDEIVRYEGASNPDDETILFALRCGHERAGLYVSGFGPSATAADVAVLGRLP